MPNKMPVVAIGIAFHSKAQQLAKAVESALAQIVPGYDVQVLVLDSSPSGCARRLLRPQRTRQSVHVVQAMAKTAYAARNRLLRCAEGRWADLEWHVRLDADDRFASASALATALRFAKPAHRVVLAGNRQVGPDGRLIGRNIPTARLFGRRHLMARLAGMAAGVFKAELPSCNLILRAGFGWRYPAKKSAEDHWLLASLLLKVRSECVLVSRTELVVYRVGGSLTLANKQRGFYLSQRKDLLEAAAGWFRDA